MSSMRTRRTAAIVLFWFGLLYGALVSILVLTGVVGPGLWFTVVAMILLAMSQGIVLRHSDRSTSKGQSIGIDGRAGSQRPDGPRRED